MQLAAIALQSLVSTGGGSDIPVFIQAFTGSHRYVAEYLVEEVLQRLPTAQQVLIYLAKGDFASASRLAPPILAILGDSPYAHRLPLIAAEAFKLSFTRIYMAQGEIEQARHMLDEMQATVEPGKRLGRLMEVHLLRGLALNRQAGR